ncbi:MAG: DUF1015 domain-containing protein [Myxococcales bacterium]|nr:DUF1015 domain-containing protein [Myxococcales bacterium]
MTRIRPFRALRYAPGRVDLDRVIAPPYDVIAPGDRPSYYDRDPHNAIRLTLTREVEQEATTDYAEIRRTLDAWQRSAVLVRDPTPALYGLRQRFVAPDGSSRVREAFFALLHLEDYARRIVRPHELTLAGPKADRLKLLRSARANLSSVLVLYEDRQRELESALGRAFEAEPVAEARDASCTHTLTRLEDPAPIEAVCRFLSERPVVIADGHHRYETALQYRDESTGGGDGPQDWMLACFANAFAPGSLLLPIHRLILKSAVPTDAAWTERLPGWTEGSVPIPSAEAIPALLAECLAPLSDRHAFAADDASGRLRIFSKPRPESGKDELTVRVVHRDVIAGVFGLDADAVREGAVDYPKDALQTARDLRSGRGSVALYLNPVAPEDVFRVTAAGEVMPQKSTFFYPKLPTGLVFRLLDEDAG